MATPQVKRYAMVGMGLRSAFYYQGIIQDFSGVAKLVGICDTNQTRMNACNDHMVELGGQRLPTHKAEDFDNMIKKQKPDVVIVITVDKFHHIYCIRAMDMGCDAIVEKPITIDEKKLQEIIDAEKKTGKRVRVSFNYRYAPHHTKVREIVQSGVIGDVTTVHMDWILDCNHGSDFMRRWHRHKESSGGIQISKSTHHFDLVQFWLNTEPEIVYAMGDLRFYGKENAQKNGMANPGGRYHNNEDAKNDPFVVYPLFGEPYEVPTVRGEGGHGGGDRLLLKDTLVGADDEFKRAAFIRDGGNAIMVGVGANHSMKSGLPVNIQELVRW